MEQLSSTPNRQLRTRHLHTLSIIGKNSLAGWNKLTSFPYNHNQINNQSNIYIYIYIFIYLDVSVCVCVCLRERERERERERDIGMQDKIFISQLPAHLST